MKRYVPDRGDVAMVDLHPVAGREQAGRRPVVVLSPRAFNSKAGLAIVCPLTTRVKGYPFEVPTEFNGRAGAALADHVKSIDWAGRGATYAGVLPTSLVSRIAALVAALICA